MQKLNELEQKIYDLWYEGLNDSEIGKRINMTSKAVAYHRHKKMNLPYNKKEVIKDYNYFKELLDNGKTDREISKILNIDHSLVQYYRRKIGVFRFDDFKNKEIVPTKRQYEIILGCLFGDGSFKKIRNQNPIFLCEHGKEQKDYCLWKSEELKSLGNDKIFSHYTRKTPDKRTGKYYESYLMRLVSNPYFNDLYEKTYKPKKEINSENIKGFSDLSLAVLFMDDGFKSNDSTITISTNCFKEESLFCFYEYCWDNFRIMFNKTSGFTSRLPKMYYKRFYDIVYPHMHKSLLYKLPNI